MNDTPSPPIIGLRIRKWHKWQTSIIRTVVKRRIDSKIPLSEPYSMGKIVEAAELDHHFLAFQAVCKEPCADGLWTRVLRYCAVKGALTGEILVQREHFGRCVLSTTWDAVSQERGERVFDALCQSQLVAPLRPTDIGKGYRQAKKLAKSAHELRKNSARPSSRAEQPRARVSGSGSGSGSVSNPQPPPEGAGSASLPSGGRKRNSKAVAKFDSIDTSTKRQANIDWAAKEASMSRDVGTWRAPAASIRADLRDKRPYPDNRVERDFDAIRAKDERGLGAIVRRLLREPRNGNGL